MWYQVCRAEGSLRASTRETGAYQAFGQWIRPAIKIGFELLAFPDDSPPLTNTDFWHWSTLKYYTAAVLLSRDSGSSWNLNVILSIASRQFYLLSNDVTFFVERHRWMVSRKTQFTKPSQDFESLVFIEFDSLASGFCELGFEKLLSLLCTVQVFHKWISENKEFGIVILYHPNVASLIRSSWLWFHFEQRF